MDEKLPDYVVACTPLTTYIDNCSASFSHHELSLTRAWRRLKQMWNISVGNADWLQAGIPTRIPIFFLRSEYLERSRELLPPASLLFSLILPPLVPWPLSQKPPSLSLVRWMLNPCRSRLWKIEQRTLSQSTFNHDVTIDSLVSVYLLKTLIFYLQPVSSSKPALLQLDDRLRCPPPAVLQS